MGHGNVAVILAILGAFALLMLVLAKPVLLIPIGLIAFAAWVVKNSG